MLTKSKALAALQTALQSFGADTGPGEWQIEKDMGDGRYSISDDGKTLVTLPQIGLTYACDQNYEFEDPWSKWGGDAIITAAGLGDHPGDGVMTENQGTSYDTAIIAVLEDPTFPAGVAAVDRALTALCREAQE